MVQCVCLYACVLEVQISKTGDFSTFFFYSKKHDTVTINNHAFYTAGACFRGQGKKKKVNPNGETEMQQAPFLCL